MQTGRGCSNAVLQDARERLRQRGVVRFEVLGLDADRELIRSLARRLAGDDPDSGRIRAAARSTISGERPKKRRYSHFVAPVASGRLRSGFKPSAYSGTQD